ncbi:MAG: ABC transporter ATP-binding protein [Pelagibacteraceae bacterium TMED136]|nr:MAG: ABC transporter ATP-binding protein [Pelagibacteraceae bacterium TMED136]|tara:strand:+ start:7802 stop:8473 length:672 start_codon:yes stop_codon:yes gene_type:complete
MSTLLELKQITLNYKNYNTSVKIIKGIDLKINSSEKVAVVGKSGSGKTSLIMLIAGLEQPTSGEIIFDQQLISTLNEDQLADIRKKKIGIVFQSFYLIPNYTALENVSLILEINSMDNSKQKAEELLIQFGLKDRLHHFPTQLSGGEQQRVAIARSMAVNPKLILADEPTGNLDSENSQMISNLLFDYANKNQSSFVLVTHDLKFAEKCDRIIKIEDGTILSS